MSRNQKNLTITIDPETEKCIERLRENNSINISSYIRKCIKDMDTQLNKTYS